MNARDEILGALRKHQSHVSPLIDVQRGEDHFSDWPSHDPVANFQERLGLLKGETYLVRSYGEARAKIQELSAASGYSRIAYSNEKIVQEVSAGQSSIRSLEDLPHDLFKTFEVGVTGCQALVARTGTVVISGRASGRRLSVLPPFHIVLADRSQLVDSLEDIIPTLSADESWSYAAFITGPSRTADIEKILVLGAHGPKRFAVILVNT